MSDIGQTEEVASENVMVDYIIDIFFGLFISKYTRSSELQKSPEM